MNSALDWSPPNVVWRRDLIIVLDGYGERSGMGQRSDRRMNEWVGKGSNIIFNQTSLYSGQWIYREIWIIDNSLQASDGSSRNRWTLATVWTEWGRDEGEGTVDEGTVEDKSIDWGLRVDHDGGGNRRSDGNDIPSENQLPSRGNRVESEVRLFHKDGLFFIIPLWNGVMNGPSVRMGQKSTNWKWMHETNKKSFIYLDKIIECFSYSRFVPIVILNEKKKKYEIQYERFDTTEAVIMNIF